MLTCNRVLKKENHVPTQLEELEQKMDQLRIQHKEIKRRQRKDAKVDDRIIGNYAKRTCRARCDKIHKGFPREIGDMIYAHIHGEERYRIDRSGYFSSESATHLLLLRDAMDEAYLGMQTI